MSAVKHTVRRRERYRAKVKGIKIPAQQGRGKADARAARRVNLECAVAQKKGSGKAMREFESLGLAELAGKLAEARKELFNLRFKQATGQLESTAALSALRKRIARILTLMTQKEVGA
jgi:large subunit ribosomal protein L29